MKGSFIGNNFAPILAILNELKSTRPDIKFIAPCPDTCPDLGAHLNFTNRDLIRVVDFVFDDDKLLMLVLDNTIGNSFYNPSKHEIISKLWWCNGW